MRIKSESLGENLRQIWTPQRDTPQNVCRNMFAPYYFWDVEAEELVNVQLKKVDKAYPRESNPLRKYYLPIVFIDGAWSQVDVSKHWIPWMLANDPDMILGHTTYDRILERGLGAFGSKIFEKQVHHIQHVENGDDPSNLIALSKRAHDVL